MDLADLLDRQFARQHQLRKTDVGEEFRFLWPTDVALGTGMQLDRGQVELEQAHVLDDQRIDASLVQLPDLLACQLEFAVVHDRVHRHEDARPVGVRELHQPGDVLERVAGIVPRPECRAADIDGIGAVQDRLAPDLGGFGGREQFKLVG